MTRKKKDVAPIVSIGEVKRPYQRPKRFHTFEYRPLGLEEGAEPLWVTVQVNLDFGEIEAINFEAGTTFEEAFEGIARYIVDWNAPALNLDTGEYEIAPPPAEAGPAILRTLDRDEAYWVITTVKNGYIRSLDLGKPEPTPKPTESPGPSGAETPST